MNIEHACSTINYEKQINIDANSAGRRCIIKDCVVVDDGAIVKDDTVMPPFTRWGGAPAKIIEELPESMSYVSAVVCVI